MKPLHCLSLLLLLPLLAPAAEPSFAKWEKEISRIEATDRAHPPAADAVLFTGSSSIRLWDLKKGFPDFPAVNHGFGGSTIPDNIHFVPRLVLPLKPKKIVFYAGDNDSAGGRSAEQIAADFTTYAETIHAALPEARIFYLPIKPSISRWKLRPLQHDANERIRRYCEAHSGWLQSIDTATPLLGADGKPVAKYFKPDGLHLTDEGYALWSPIVAKALKDGGGK